MLNILKQRRLEKFIDELDRKELLKRYFYLIIGCFISAFAFNVFFYQYGIVSLGISGLSIVLSKYGIDSTTFMFVMNIFLLILSFLLLGFEKTKNSIIGSLLYPLFILLTKPFINLIPLHDVEQIVIVIFGAVLMGVGSGFVFKTGFTTGGTDIINQIICKYSKISMGNAILLVDGLVVLSAKLVFPWEKVLYGYITLYLISMITDKVLLGISQSKAFYIVTDKSDEVRDFLLSITSGGVTLIGARGGYSNDKETMILAVIPTRQYFYVKEGIREIDEDVFFLVCDAYEVARKKITNNSN